MDSSPSTGLAISRLHFPVSTLGPGQRVGVWFQGCSIRCKGCVSLDTWERGKETVPIDIISDRIAIIAGGDKVDGITFSGGEPFDQPNAFLVLLNQLRRTPSLREADIFVYSGYSLTRLRRAHQPILALVDALMSGPYVASRPTALPWRGSSNQRLTLFTKRARERFESVSASPALQLSTDGGRLWITGIPRRGDLARLEDMLADRGVLLEDVSWRA